MKGLVDLFKKQRKHSNFKHEDSGSNRGNERTFNHATTKKEQQRQHFEESKEIMSIRNQRGGKGSRKKKQKPSSPVSSSSHCFSSPYASSSSYSSSSSSGSSFMEQEVIQGKQWRNRDKTQTKNRRKSRYREKRDYKNNEYQSNFLDSNMLTREELFELPARELRNKCRILGLDASRVAEKEGLVLLIHEFYRRQSNEKKFHLDPSLIGDTRMSNSLALRTDEPNNVNIQSPPTASKFSMLNDENEQMIEILFEIIPYYGQGDLSIDSIVKDTIQRLPFYCLESRDKVSGNTLIMIASHVGSIDLVMMLIRRGSDINAQNHNGETSLHFVCYSDSYSPDIAKELINHGANPEVSENRFGCTPLHWVASAGDVELCKILCAAGAKATTLDKSGFDPIAYSKQCQKMECIDFLLSTCSDSKTNICNEDSIVSTKSITNEDDNNLGWEKLLDKSSGYFYFHNWRTGESMWEEDYMVYQRSIVRGSLKPITGSFSNRPPPPLPTKEKSLNDVDTEYPKLDSNAQGKETADVEQFDLSEEKEQKNNEVKALSMKKISFRHIDSNELRAVLSDSDISSSKHSSLIGYDEESEIHAEGDDIYEAKTEAMISKDSFNMRIHALQSSMEDQITEKLKGIEERITNKANEDMKSRELEDLKATISDLTSKVVYLQAEVGTKDLEIGSLKNQMSTVVSEYVPKSESRDAWFGDSDIRENMWVQVDDMKKLSRDISDKDRKILCQQNDISTLQSTINVQVKEIELLKENQTRGKEQVLQIEELLNQEKKAKMEALMLLEQAHMGTKVDAEVTKTLEIDKRRIEEELKRAREELKTTQMRMSEKIVMNNAQLEEHQREILCERSKVKSLQEIIKVQQDQFTEEKEELDHKHMQEIEVVRSSLRKSNEEMLHLAQKELDNEKLISNRHELERDEAINAYEEALVKSKNAEREVKRMASLIEEAKTLVSANEKLHRSLQVEIDKRKVLHNHLEDLRGKIRVYVRIRPLSLDEIKRECTEVLIKEDKRTCVMNTSNISGIDRMKSWEFDNIFYGQAIEGNSQEDIFKDTRRLVTSTIDGFNVCIFAYGQTGSGKTYTMFGQKCEGSLNPDAGLAPRVAFELFQLAEERKTSFDVQVTMNMFELYNDNVRDLMASEGTKNKTNDNTLRIKLAEHSETGLVQVEGAVSISIQNALQMIDLFKKGSEFRTTSSTKMNADSSRSHLITSVTVSLTNRRTGQITNGKITLVDLAGCERVKKSGATGQQLKEAQSINKSLSALGDVINALTTGSQHIPYRNHPLTMLMSDSMGGSAKTLMFVCCSPADYNESESSNALDFAKRCKDVTNNVVGCGTLGELGQMKALRAQLSRLKSEKGDSMKKILTSAKKPGRK